MEPTRTPDNTHPRHLWGRAALALAVIVLSAASSLTDRAPAHAPDLESAIEEKTGLALRKGTVRLLDEAPDGASPRPRTVLFLAATRSGEPSDLYSAQVKLRKDRTALSVARPVNLSSTPQADERNLVISPPLAAVCAFSLGQARAVTLFDFRGVAMATEAPWSRTTWFLARLSNYLETGRLTGVGKTTFRFGRPPKELEIGFESGKSGSPNLTLQWHQADGQTASAQIDPEQLEATTPDTLSATVVARLPKSPILWMVDTIRALSFVGPRPIEWAEGRFFAAKDALRRFAWRHGFASDLEDAAPSTPSSISSPHKAIVVPPGLSVGELDPSTVFPPAPIDPPVFSRRAEGEGLWKPGSPNFRQAVLEGDDFIYRTYLRTDAERPYVKVELFAMDMRRLSLHMVAGLEDPEPTTGSQGTGIIPRDPELLPRVVAAWNGAFKTLHGAYGMVANRDVLLPPKDNAATVASFEDGRSAMGSWPPGASLPSTLTDLRQNMDPLVENGVVNPRRRYLWGFTLDEDITAMNTIRSGLCMTQGGHLVYAWGEDLTATTLAVAMNAAGCVYGMHLDMNPFHTSFIHYRFDPLEPGGKPVFDAQLAIPAMRYSLQRYVFASPKDFFFVALKPVGPGKGWSSQGLAQPAPADIPAVFEAKSRGCRLVAVDLSRARLFLSSGEVPSHLLPAPVRLPAADAPLLLIAARLRSSAGAVGQIAQTARLAPMAEGLPTVALSDDGQVHLGPWSEASLASTTTDAVQAMAVTGETQTIAVGLLQNRFLVLGVGPAATLKEVLTEHGITLHVDFAATEDPSVLLVRGEAGMLDEQGRSTANLDTASATLYVLAAPRPMGMQPLSTLVGSGRVGRPH